MSSRDATGDAAGELRHLIPDVESLAQRLASVDYLVDEALATSMFLSLRLPQPLLLEGEAGVGKTEAGKSLAAILDTPLIRLQCYDGIDAAEALYEWNYPRQLLSIRLADTRDRELSEEDLQELETKSRQCQPPHLASTWQLVPPVNEWYAADVPRLIEEIRRLNPRLAKLELPPGGARGGG